MANNDNSGTGVILGILVAVVLAAGVYYFAGGHNEPDLSINTPAGNISAEVPNAE